MPAIATMILTMSKRSVAVVCAVTVSVIWGLSFLSTKIALAVMPPMTIAVARFAVAVVAILPVALLRREDLRFKLRDLPLMVSSGLLGTTLYFLCENNGIALITASESSLVIATIPVLTLLVDRVILKTRLKARSYAGALLSFAGVALIVAPSLGGASSPIEGFAFMGGAAACWVAYALLTKPLSGKYGGLSITFWQSLFGLAGCVPFALAESRGWVGALSLSIVLNLLYLGLLCSAAGYLLYIVAIDRLGAGASSVFLNLVPIVSVVAAYFILGERLGSLTLAGGVIAVGGVYLATTPGTSSVGGGKNAGAAKGGVREGHRFSS
jgi:drug/metabolite transporter (DMT)-like permease